MKIAVLNKKYPFGEGKRDVLIGENKDFQSSRKNGEFFKKRRAYYSVKSAL